MSAFSNSSNYSKQDNKLTLFCLALVASLIVACIAYRYYYRQQMDGYQVIKANCNCDENVAFISIE